MQDIDREASEALLALGSTVTSSEHIEIDLSLEKENKDKDKVQERDYVIVKNKDKKDPLVECVYCAHLYFGVVPRIRAHLAKLPNRGIIPCNKAPPNVVKAFQDKDKAIADKAKKAQDEKDLRARLASQSKRSTCLEYMIFTQALECVCVGASSHPVTSGTQGPLSALWAQKNCDSVDMAVAKFVYGNAISFNVIDSPYFKDMVASIAKYGSSYKPPASTQLRTSLLEKTKKEVDIGLQVAYIFVMVCMRCTVSNTHVSCRTTSAI